MKLLKKSLLLSLIAPLLFSLLSFTNAVEGDVVTIRVFESVKGSGIPARISIIEDGKLRSIELEPYNRQNPEQNKNLEIFADLIKQYHKSGFKIETSNAIKESGQMVSTYILTK